MNITVIGRGKVGGGWLIAGSGPVRTVTRIGRDGGDSSDSDAVLVAVQSGQIAAALGKVSGLAGKVAIDATNPSPGAMKPSSRSATKSSRSSAALSRKRLTPTSRTSTTR